MHREALVTFGFCLMGIAAFDMLFGEILHQQKNVVLDSVIGIVGLVVSASASRSKWNERRPWLPPHDPMKNHDGTYDF